MALEDDDQQSTETLNLARPYYSYITEADRRAADEALAKFVYSSNSPLGLLENKHSGDVQRKRISGRVA